MFRPAKTIVLGALVAVLPLAALAEFKGRRSTRVNPVNDAVFEVVPRGSGDGPIFWCGAADYAQRALRAPWTAQIYIARGRGQSVTTGRRSSVQFTLDPGAAGIQPAPSSLSLNSLKVGEHMSVQQAFSYCNTSPVQF